MVKRNGHGKTYTKRLTRNVMFVGVIAGFMPYILSALDREPVEELGIAWVTGIVAVSLGYFVRGFKDSKAEADDAYRKYRAEHLFGESCCTGRVDEIENE